MSSAPTFRRAPLRALAVTAAAFTLISLGEVACAADAPAAAVSLVPAQSEVTFVAKQLGVQSYPTIIYVAQGGKRYVYTGDRTVDAIVAFVDEAEVAVQRLGRIEKTRRHAGAVERRGDFLGDVGVFADAGEDKFPVGGSDRIDGIRRRDELPAEEVAQGRVLHAQGALLQAPLRRGAGQHHALEGEGVTRAGNVEFHWKPQDVFVVPSWCPVSHHASTEAVLFSFSDRPAQQALGLWREQNVE